MGALVRPAAGPLVPLDVVGIGNALVDVLAHTDDAFITEHDLARGRATMVDEARAEIVYRALGPTTEQSGGSAANTIAGLASFGAEVGFVGRVRDDQLGAVFAHDLRSLGVHYDTPPAPAGPATGRALVLVTPDAQRTMCVFLGASQHFGPIDVNAAHLEDAKVVYLEGYLWDQPSAKQAMRHAMTLANEGGARVAFTLSDPFCVERHREEFRALIETSVDVLFANEAEICSLYQVDTFDDALQHVRHHTEIAALTRSERGSVVCAGDELHVVDVVPVKQLIDTTGAGDQFAAGFLYGLVTGADLARCGQLGSLAAAEVVSHLGARPEIRLASLAT